MVEVCFGCFVFLLVANLLCHRTPFLTMTATFSKRNQARNEKVLQELIRSVPGNDRCADCGARNPGWASWSLGIFLCMRCASLHRKLGTHISKVKSLSMDSWSNEQVEGMKRNGNTASNRTYNPQNKKPQIPLDVDEVDAALERFIRQKYDQQLFSSNAPRPAVRHDTGSTRSSDDQPPPLPPKPGKRFGWGLRSVSSALPLSRSSRTTPPTSPDGSTEYGAPPSPIRVNKQSRVFGTSVGATNGEDLDAKLATLRDMGFPDDRRNASILKGVGGNLERAIEALVRLGEGSTPSSRSRTPAQVRNFSASHSFPLALATQGSTTSNGGAVGLSISAVPSQATEEEQTHNQGSNPSRGFDDRNFSPTPSQTSNTSFHASNPFQPRPYNPFETSSGNQSATLPLERAFENMTVSQPLFPNATGGYPQAQQYNPDPRIQHSMTPPVPQIPQQYYQINQHTSQTQTPYGSSNPFMQTPQPSFTTFSNSYASAAQIENPGPSYNPFMNAQRPPTQLPISEYPPQPSQPFYQEQQQQVQPFPPNASQVLQNPYMIQSQQTNQTAFNYQQDQPYTQTFPTPLQVQQTGRIDKSSIMALYNYPQLAPPPLRNVSEDAVSPPQNPNNPPAPQYPQGVVPKHGQRSATMPVQMSSGSRNPFQTTAQANPSSSVALQPSTNGAGMSRHVSQESVDIGGFQSGRHSPDAFASLSARYVR